MRKIETVIRTVSTAFILCIPSYVDNWKSEKRLHEIVISVCGKKEIIRQWLLKKAISLDRKEVYV